MTRARRAPRQARLCDVCGETRTVQVKLGRYDGPPPPSTCRPCFAAMPPPAKRVRDRSDDIRVTRWDLTRWPVLDGALCADLDPEVWFNPARERDAVAVCNTCPARDLCLKFALDNEIGHGVWGATTPDQRHKLRATG